MSRSLRTMKRLALFALAGPALSLIGAPAYAVLSTYRAGIDVDNLASTGCDFSLGSVPPGTLPGFEFQLTVVVDDDPIPPQVVSAQVETCNGATFADPQPLAGFVVDLDSGLLGSDSVIGSIPLSLLGNASVVRLAFHALSGGSEDALFTVDGSPDGRPIVLFLDRAAIPVVSGLGLCLAVIALFGLGWVRRRYGRWGFGSAMLALTIAGGAVVAYAAFGDPLAVDDPDDASPPNPRAEIIAAFAMRTDGELTLRLDIEDFPTEKDCADATDNDLDGAVDCADGNCVQRPCNDTTGCTLDDMCTPFHFCEGIPVDCAQVEGNECSTDVCVSVSSAPGNTHFKCNSMLDATKLDFGFGSCTPDCAVARNPDGTCPQPTDLCVVGRCVVQAGDPPAFVCESATKLEVDEPVGCIDSNPCTTDVCIDGTCDYASLDSVPCDDGNPCTTGDTCNIVGTCQGAPDAGASCDDGNSCTDDTCVAGECVGVNDNANSCDDDNPCTNDTCVNGLCAGASLPNNTACNDGVACTSGTVCNFGVCTDGTLNDAACVTDANPCTEQNCTELGCESTLMTGTMPCQAMVPECVLGTQICEQGEPSGDCVPNVPAEPCP